MINSILNCICRLYKVIVYHNVNVHIHPSVKFNSSSLFSGYNRIHARSNVSNTSIGRNTFVGLNCHLVNATIGSFCSIAHDVKVEDSTHPTNTFVSTSPVFYSIYKQTGQSFVTKNLFNEFLTIEGRSCIIGNDVWIGANVLIKGGIRIGDGAIVAMGAVVTKDVEPYTIVAGVPAKPIRKRFSDSDIERLVESKWWECDDAVLRHKVEMFSNISNYSI